jgi:hypothetical protein
MSDSEGVSGLLVEIRGRKVATYKGLLAKAHSDGLVSITSEVLQFPADANANTCIVLARVVMGDGGEFTGIGDANPGNVSKNIAPHMIRMAETRAKGRALRDAVNVGTVCQDELHDLSPEAAEDFKGEKLGFLRWAANWRREQGIDSRDKGQIATPAWVVLVLRDLYDADTIDDRTTLKAVADAIEAGEYDPATGERVGA